MGGAPRDGRHLLGAGARLLGEVQGCVTCKQATSYWKTVAVLFEWANEGVLGFPAYAVPEVPEGLNGEPPAFVETARH